MRMAYLDGSKETPNGRIRRCMKNRQWSLYSVNYSMVASSFLPRDARSARAVPYCYRKLSVRLSVRPSDRLSVTLNVVDVYRGHIGWTSSKVIARIISLGSSLLVLGATTSAI